MGTALGAAFAMLAVALLASMGIDASNPDGPGRTSMLLKGIGAVASLAITFGLTARLLRREEERQARGRVVVIGARESGAKSAIALALGCIALGLFFMAGLEVAASAVASDEEEGQASPGESALEQARESRNAGLGDAAESGRSNPNGGSAKAGLIGPNQQSGAGAQGASGVKLGDLLSDEPILRVTSDVPLPAPTAHFRGLVLDRYGSNGTLQERMAAAPAIFDADATGWISVPDEVTSRPGWGASQGMELQVELLAPSNGVIFAPSQLIAIETQRATHNPAAALWTAAPYGNGRQVQRYGIRSEWPTLTVAELSAKRARASLPVGSLSLPRGSTGGQRALALRSLKAYADSIAAGSASDLEEVIAIVSHLRGAFGYELFDAGMISPERCLELIERGSGSCTHFASLAVLLLRSRNIPSRIAVGYVAREELLPDEGPGWLVRSRDGHAWIEVHFEDYGWLPFDPTPGDSTAGGASTGWTPLAESQPAVARWLDSRGSGGGKVGRGARTSALGEWVADALAGTFRVIRDVAVSAGHSALGRHSSGAAGWILGLLGVGALGVWGWRRRLRSRGNRPSPDDGQAGITLSAGQDPELAPQARVRLAALPAAQELMKALAQRGLFQAPSATPSRFARDVEAEHPESAGLAATVRALLRRASTNAQLTEDELSALRELVARIRQGGEQESGERNAASARR